MAMADRQTDRQMADREMAMAKTGNGRQINKVKKTKITA